MIGQELREDVVRARGLAARTAMDQQQRRCLALRRRLMRLPQDVGDDQAIACLEAHHAGVDQIVGIQPAAERGGQAFWRALAEFQHVKIVWLAVTVEIKGHSRFRTCNAQVADLPGRQRWQCQFSAGGIFEHVDAGPAIHIGHVDAELAVVREGNVDDVPGLAAYVLMSSGGEVVTSNPAEFAALVAGVVQVLAVGREIFGAEAGITLVRGEVDGFSTGQLDQMQVVVVGRAGLGQRQVTPIAGNRTQIQALRVLVDTLACVGRGVVAVKVEKLCITLIGGDVKSAAGMIETQKIGLQLVAGREVLFAAVELDHIQVIQLVAALVTRNQLALIGRKVGHRIVVVGGRGRYCRPIAATRRHGVGIPHAGLVRGKQDSLLVR